MWLYVDLPKVWREFWFVVEWDWCSYWWIVDYVRWDIGGGYGTCSIDALVRCCRGLGTMRIWCRFFCRFWWMCWSFGYHRRRYILDERSVQIRKRLNGGSGSGEIVGEWIYGQGQGVVWCLWEERVFLQRLWKVRLVMGLKYLEVGIFFSTMALYNQWV